MHSDGNGLFYVFDIDDLTTTTHDNIEAKVERPSHGKLLWSESPKLGNRGFGTATGETFLFEFDMVTKEQVTAYDYSVEKPTVLSGSTAATKTASFAPLAIAIGMMVAALF